jgi:hypothetical protein
MIDYLETLKKTIKEGEKKLDMIDNYMMKVSNIN